MTFTYRPVTWVTVKKIAELTGRSEGTFNNLVADGHLVEGVHWKWSQDNIRHFNLEAYDKWVENSTSKGSMRGRRRSSSASNGKDVGTGNDSTSSPLLPISGLRLA